jgi:CheY-like chemotaxis protein
MAGQQKDWRELARLAANEQDSKKLLGIIAELNQALEDRFNQLRGKPKVPKPGGNRLLFVDDEPSIRLTLPPILRERGFAVTDAASVSEALTTLKTQQFDVLLCDINIDREGDGFTVVRAMRQANPDCVAILLTAYPGFENALQGIRDEVDDYFTKPAELNAVISSIDAKLLARGIVRTVAAKHAA